MRMKPSLREVAEAWKKRAEFEEDRARGLETRMHEIRKDLLEIEQSDLGKLVAELREAREEIDEADASRDALTGELEAAMSFLEEFENEIRAGREKIHDRVLYNDFHRLLARYA